MYEQVLCTPTRLGHCKTESHLGMARHILSLELRTPIPVHRSHQSPLLPEPRNRDPWERHSRRRLLLRTREPSIHPPHLHLGRSSSPRRRNSHNYVKGISIKG